MIDLQTFDGPKEFSISIYYNTTIQGVLDKLYRTIHYNDKNVAKGNYQRGWILIDAKKGAILNVGTEYGWKCNHTESDNRLATAIVPLGSQLTAWSCDPKHKGYYQCPPVECSK